MSDKKLPKDDNSIDMSDEEARLLLQQMEAPTEPPKPSETSTQDSNETKVVELDDDEARRLLAEMEAPPSPVKSEAAVQTEVKNTPPVEEEKIEEIAEWEANDFQSDKSMLDDFLTNAADLMSSLDETILKLEQNPEEKETIEAIFRAAHTLKGASGMFGFRGLERVMHRMENLFDLVRKGKLVPNSNIIDVVFKGLDLIKTLLEAVKNGKPCGIATAPIVRALSQVAKGEQPNLTDIMPVAKHVLEPITKTAPQSDSTPSATNSDKESTNKTVKTESSTIRVDLQRLDVLVNLVGELVIDRTRFSGIEDELRNNHPQIKVTGSLAETVQLFGRHMGDVQDIIMKIRMVPIGNAFSKFPRVVRDLARSLGKEIDLVLAGEANELDKTLVEQIGDPLIHLIRNACDHGVESPETRERAGKPKKGTVRLAAEQQGNQILITIEDDGKGMDPEKIKVKAIEKGLIRADQALTDREVFDLIFLPGFSTAEKVTNVSGRGVGMDVVKKQISKLKGVVEIDSTPGKGSKITIRLPLTLAIVKSLVVGCRGETFAVPAGSVIEAIRINPNEIQKVGDMEVIKLRERVLPLVHLADTLDMTNHATSFAMTIKKFNQNKSSQINSTSERKNKHKSERVFIAVVGSNDNKFGIVVDELLHQQEMVIKSLGPLMQNIPCIAGGAVLGNGEVVLVLDVAEIEDRFKANQREKKLAAA